MTIDVSMLVPRGGKLDLLRERELSKWNFLSLSLLHLACELVSAHVGLSQCLRAGLLVNIL